MCTVWQRYNGCDPCNMVYYLRLDESFGEYIAAPTGKSLRIVKLINYFRT